MIKYIIIIAFLMGCASNPCPMYCAVGHEHKYNKNDEAFLDWYAKEYIKYRQTEKEYRRVRQTADSLIQELGGFQIDDTLQLEMVKDVLMEVDSVWFDTTGNNTQVTKEIN